MNEKKNDNTSQTTPSPVPSFEVEKSNSTTHKDIKPLSPSTTSQTQTPQPKEKENPNK